MASQEWRGDAEAQPEVEQVIHLEMVADSQATQTDTVAHALSILSKEDEAPSSVDATLSQSEAV